MPVQGVAGLQIEQYDRVLIATENGSQVLLDENPSLNGHSDKLVVFFGELATKSGA